MMKIVIASDFSGFRLKEAVRTHLVGLGFEVADVGQQAQEDSLLYYEAASNLAKAIQSGAYDKGIVFCGTGAGVSMIANKHVGVYCVACESIFTAEKISLINNANNNWAIRPDLPQAPETCRQVSAVRAGAKEPYSRPHAICVWRKTAAERNGRAGISAFVSFL